MAKGRHTIQCIAISNSKKIIGTMDSLSVVFQCSKMAIWQAIKRCSSMNYDGEIFYFDHLLTEEMENV